MDQIITQCPNCGTSFRVTPQQLQVANGAVRCGSCMHIFQAASHHAQKSATKPEHHKAAADTEENAKISQDNTSEFSNSFLNLDGWKDDGSDPLKYELNQLGEDTNETDEHWAEKLLEEAESEPTIPPASTLAEKKKTSIKPLRKTAAPTEHRAAPAEQNQDSANSELSFSALDDELLFPDDEPIPDNTQDHRQFLNHIEPEPLELHYGERSRWLVNTVWGLAIGLAMAALPAQFFFFEFDRLSRDSAYRPWYAFVCQSIHCTLPDLEDIRLIRASNLMVRTHPDADNALIVDAIVMNLASYQQRFPELELIFTDMQGQIVAGRIFKVSEYLNGELAGASVMPPQRPIHLSLEITDPGQNATNYALQLHFPKAG